MNTEANSAEPAKEEKERKAAKGGMPGSWLVIALVLAALVLSGLAFWSSLNVRHRAAAGQAQLADLQASLAGYQAMLESMKNRSAAMEGGIADISQQQDKLKDSITALYKNQSRGNQDWVLAQVEYLVVIAAYSLTLERDVNTALAALQAADDRLRELGDLRLINIRKQLTADMNALRSVKPVDVAGLSLFLADVEQRVETLPLKDRPAPRQREETPADNGAEEKRSAFARLMHEFWQELKSLVIITRNDKDPGALLLPDEKYFLYQNLRLQLESARIAVLRRDSGSFRASLQNVIAWLEKYFNGADAGVSHIMDSLRDRLDLDLDPDLPDISASLDTIREFIKQRSATLPTDDGEPVS